MKKLILVFLTVAILAPSISFADSYRERRIPRQPWPSEMRHHQPHRQPWPSEVRRYRDRDYRHHHRHYRHDYRRDWRYDNRRYYRGGNFYFSTPPYPTYPMRYGYGGYYPPYYQQPQVQIWGRW